MKKKKNFKIISIVITLFVISTLISLKGLIATATVADRPEFDIEFSPIPESARVGEDIVVKGTITPKPFEILVPEKEIVFVVDKDPLNNGKLTSLMSETKNFIARIVQNDKFKNIKTAIIEYDKDAEIYRDNEVAFLDLKIDTDRTKIVNKLSAIGKGQYNKTNTGEALRKALYLLNSKESSKNANKTIIFISDSIPTARTLYSKVSDKYGNFYTNITSDKYVNATTDNSNDVNKDLEYAKEMSKSIKEKGYNVFTIAYGLDKDNKGEPALREIHEAMSGNDLSNKDNDEKNGFFISSDTSDAAKNVFLNIADRVLQNYSLNNIKMNLNFTGDFSLNIKGNTVNLSNINYELKSVSNGKARYEATPISFEFTVKGNREGYQQIFDKVTITYPWQDSIEKVDINKELFITIKSNELPSISANLISDKTVSIEENSEFTLKYEINPESFSFANESNSIKSDVVFVIDVSSGMSNYMNPLMNDLWNDILNNDKLKGIKAEYDIITFSDTIKNVVDLNSNNYSQYGDYITELNDKYIKNILKSDSSNVKNISSTYNDIIRLLDNGRVGARKNVVLISETGNILYGDKKDYSILKEKGYNIITVEMKNLNNSTYKNNLKDFHESLGGTSANYFYTEDQNDLQNNILLKVANSIASNKSYNDYVFNPVLNINLGQNFEVVSGIDNINNNIASIKIPEIRYRYSEIDNKYTSNKVTVEFTLKPVNGKKGNLLFGNENKLVYKKLIGNENKYYLVETPTVIIKEEVKNITHGLYNGINNGQISIQENNNGNLFEIAQGSIATFGASFTFSGSGTEFNLNVDSKFSTLNPSNIKIYKVLKDSYGNRTLKELDATNKVIVDNGDNKFKISINNITDSSTDILVIYQGKIKEEIGTAQTLTNNIVFGSTPTTITIVTPKQSTDSPTLPDLF